MSCTTTEKLLWVCELNKDQPMKKWVPSNVLEFEDEDDTDFVCNSLVIKSAVLGANAVENERNLVAFRTKGYQDKKDFEQPIFSLTLGRNDMVSGLDLTLAAENEVEFKLVQGTGPVFITCTHLMELPANEQQTMMTNSEVEDEEIEDMAEDMDEVDEVKGKRNASLKNGNGTAAANGNGATNGAAANGNGHALKKQLSGSKNGGELTNGGALKEAQQA